MKPNASLLFRFSQLVGLIFCIAVSNCVGDLTLPMAPPPPCPKQGPPGTSKLCWDFSQDYTLEYLREEGWTFDSYWQVQSNNALQNLEFMGIMDSSKLSAFLPVIPIQNQSVNQIRLRVKLDVALTGYGNFLYMLARFEGEQDKRLFSIVSLKNGEVQLVLDIPPTPTLRLWLECAVSRGATFRTGAVQIHQIELTPLCNNVPCSLN